MEDQSPSLQDINIDIPPKGDMQLKNYVYNLIRTTQRNYIDLTSIADNKANILVSINSLMLTLLIPIVLSNYEIIMQKMIYIPIGMLTLTCLMTVFISVMVLTPFKGDALPGQSDISTRKRSPFFFTGYADLNIDQYLTLFQNTTTDKSETSKIVVTDLYYFGKILSKKYANLKMAYRMFNLGLMTSFIIFILVLFI
ncbi:MAG: Pycsar system effector family protein [Saprospiraceae bacterium]